MLDGRNEYRSAGSPQRQVIGFGAAPGKNDFSSACIDRRSDCLARILYGAPGKAPEAVDRGRIAA
jgi:hypothetical protein